jgi:hypothetical protein
VLTPRRVALAAAEACWEGLLGLPPVKRVRLAGVLVARALGTDSSLFSLSHTLGGLGGGRHCRLSVSFSSVRSRVRSSSQVGERKVREVVEIRYSPTTRPRKSPALGILDASGMYLGFVLQTTPTHSSRISNATTCTAQFYLCLRRSVACHERVSAWTRSILRRRLQTKHGRAKDSLLCSLRQQNTAPGHFHGF